MTNTHTSIIHFSATELAARIRSGEISARDAVEAHITRIEAVNPKLNAVIYPMFEEARAAAEAADAARANNQALGPLHGVPITIKDQFLVKGTPTTWGLKNRANHRATADGPLVSRLRAAGAIILGKTNVPQLLFYAESDNPLYGRTNNPWNVDRVPGGSSGGEGAIIAAGGSAFGVGGDIGGSLRVPAHFCGISTLKPTERRYTGLDNVIELDNGQEGIIAMTGPMARSVADVTLGLRIFTAPGLEEVDPLIPPVPWRDPAQIQLAGKRVALYTDDGFFPASPGVRRAVREAADALRDAGVTVEEWAPPDVTEGMALFVALLGADGGAGFKRILVGEKTTPQIAALFQAANLPKSLRPSVMRLLEAQGQRRDALMVKHIRPYSTDEYWGLVKQRAAYRARFLAALDAERYDAILCPPHALPALTHGATTKVPLAASYSMLYNLLGMPGGVVPVTRVRPGEESDRPASRDAVEKMALRVEKGSAGLPLGVQVVARHWQDELALALMAAIEPRVATQTDYPAWPPL